MFMGMNGGAPTACAPPLAAYDAGRAIRLMLSSILV
jgi:hypothetical protein